jgi:hypothetical protein
VQARALVVVGALVASAKAAAAPAPGPGEVLIRGEVTAATSRWTADGTRIVTESTIRAADGTTATVSQLGGTVGTLAMRTIPGPAILAPGMEVEVIAARARTGAGRDVLAAGHVTVVRDARLPFVRTGRTPGGHYLYWASGCAIVATGAEGTRAIAGDTELDVIAEVFAHWNTEVAGCSYMTLVDAGTREEHEVGRDKVNIIKFRDVSWCRPAVDDDPPRCYSTNTAGVTTVTYVNDPGGSRDGEIVDADIELNGVDFALAVNGVTLDDGACLSELANTLTHEVGHLLGLEHTCRVPEDPERVDGNGDPVPLCAGVTDPVIRDATMFNFQDCGETKKATVEPDDVAGVCAAYPLADDPNECRSPGDPAGCCDAGGASSPAAPLALSGLVVLGMLRVTRRRRRT